MGKIVVLVLLIILGLVIYHDRQYDIFNAVYSGDVDWVKKVLDKYPKKANELFYDSSIERSILQEAVTRSDIEIIEELLKSGADINYQGYYLDTALHYATGKKDIVEFLLKNKAVSR